MSGFTRRAQRGAAENASGGNPQGPDDYAEFGWLVNETNTGIARHGLTIGDMTLYTGPAKLISGTYDKMLFTSMIDTSNPNVTITRSVLRPTGEWLGGRIVSQSEGQVDSYGPSTRNKIIDCEITGEALSATGQAWLTGVMGCGDVIGCNIHHLGSGVATIWTYGSTFDVLIQSNYIHDLISIGNPATTGNHCDAYTVREFPEETVPRKLYILRNRIECITANASGAVFIQPIYGDIQGMTVQDNWLASNNWVMSIEVSHSGNTASAPANINNRWSAHGLPTYGAITSVGPWGNPEVDNYYYANNPPTYAGAAL